LSVVVAALPEAGTTTALVLLVVPVFAACDDEDPDLDCNSRNEVFFLSYHSSFGKAIDATEAVVISYSSS
jgi:hypothetical protein